MPHGRSLVIALVLALLGCGPRIDAEPATAPRGEPEPEPTVPVCAPVDLEHLAAFAVEQFENAYFRFDSDGSRWDDPRSLELSFINDPLSAYVGVGAAASAADVELALTLPSGAAYADLVPLTAELAGIGARAAGFTLTRVGYRDNPRGTRRYTWNFTEVGFTRCGLVVRVGAELEPPTVIRIARDLDRWLASRCGHTDTTICVAPA